MKRLIATIGTALAGTTAGYVLHQTMALRKMPTADHEPQALIIGAPLATAGLAAVVGLVFGKRSRLVALVAGFLAAATLGDKIDDMIPGWPGSKQQVLDRFGKAGSATELAGVAPVKPSAVHLVDNGADGAAADTSSVADEARAVADGAAPVTGDTAATGAEATTTDATSDEG
jgi:hypothetical protein